MNTKLPPNDNDAEEAVIGSLVIDGDAIRQIESKIQPDDFYYETNKWMYQACVALRSRREAINQITIAQELDLNSRLDACGGSAHLSYLISICPTSLDIEHYAHIVRRLSTSRQMIALGDIVANMGYRADPDVNATVEALYDKIVEFRKENTVLDALINPHGAGDAVLDLIDEYNSPKHSISYGYKDLDKITSGIYPELTVIGGRPSVGKTQIMLDIMENIAKQSKIILFCSAEMSLKMILERKVARELKLDIRLLRKSGLSGDMMKKISDLAGEVSEQKIYYMPQGVSSNEIYSEAKRLQDTIGLDIVFVDYLQMLKDCWTQGGDNHTVRVGRACKVLKSIVNELDVPLIVASQLSRASEYRTGDNRYPVLADLRESGDIEQDADIVFLLHRDKETDEAFDDSFSPNVLRVQMAKNRQLGWAKNIKLTWAESLRRYMDYSGDHYEQP